MKKSLSDMYLLDRKWIFCNKTKLYRLKDKRLNCKKPARRLAEIREIVAITVH
ncbi:hypothetical protein HYT91_01590 [Candidatus Pacearchaeota archaeon]|nr:hypothetical protein [Candidatus Pacearchaeota archaeon]